MMRQRFLIFASYVSAASVAVLLALALSLKFLGRTQAQPTGGAANAGSSSANAGASGLPTDSSVTSSGSDIPASGGESSLSIFLEPFIYDSNNRRDPFQPSVDFRQDDSVGPEKITGKFETDDFELVGIMWDIREPKAMFVDPERKVHIMGRDESIGRRNGYIAAIREGEVVVVESQKKQGELVYKTKVMKIRR